MAHQVGQELDLAAGQLDVRRATDRATPRDLHHQVARTQGLGSLRGAAADHRPQPCHQDRDAERLDQVVVGPAVEGVDLVALRVLRRQHHHRRPDLACPQVLHHLQAVHAGQAEVEEDGLVDALGGRPQPVRAGVHDVDREALVDQSPRHHLREPHLVLDEQHPGRLRASAARGAARELGHVTPSGRRCGQPSHHSSCAVTGHDLGPPCGRTGLPRASWQRRRCCGVPGEILTATGLPGPRPRHLYPGLMARVGVCEDDSSVRPGPGPGAALGRPRGRRDPQRSRGHRRVQRTRQRRRRWCSTSASPTPTAATCAPPSGPPARTPRCCS